MEYEALEQDFSNRGRRLEEQVAVLRAAVDAGAGHVRRPVAPPRPRRPQPSAGATPDPDLDGIVRRQHRREGPRAHRPSGRRLDAAVPARRAARRCVGTAARVRGGGRTRSRARWGSSAACASAADDDPQKWIDTATAFRDLGATHLRVSSMGGGYSTPAEHLAAWIQWHDAVAPSPATEECHP